METAYKEVTQELFTLFYWLLSTKPLFFLHFYELCCTFTSTKVLHSAIIELSFVIT